MLRFAPSPTGDIHIGNLRVAIFNYIVSVQKNDNFIVRIEDTDTERNIDGKDREIVEILDLFKIKFSELLYQSHNLKFHQQFASTLLQTGRAFLCFCTEEELEKNREEAKANGKPPRYSGKCEKLSDNEVLNMEVPSVVRIKKPDFAVQFTDTLRGEMSFQPDDIDNFVLLRKDKKPTYNFACAVDDMLSDISTVIRGEDHLSNTPKQIAVQHALGYGKKIEYVHLPIILNSDGKKMSKRDSASSVKWLLSEGFIPEAISNYLILLGNKTEKEIFSLEDAFKWFKVDEVSKSPAKFDIDKLRFINREHLKILDSEELSKRLGFFDSSIGELAKVYLEEASTLNELKTKLQKIFDPRNYSGEFFDGFSKIREGVSKLDEIPEDFGTFKKSVMAETGLKGKNFFKPLRIFLTAEENGPELSSIYPYLRAYIPRF
jgi:glutamyl-tRNA synthetase